MLPNLPEVRKAQKQRTHKTRKWFILKLSKTTYQLWLKWATESSPFVRPAFGEKLGWVKQLAEVSLKGMSPRVPEQPNVVFLNVEKKCCYSLVALHVSAFGAYYWTDEGEEVPWVQVDSLVCETFSSFPIAPTTTSHRWLDLSPSLESSDRENKMT